MTSKAWPSPNDDHSSEYSVACGFLHGVESGFCRFGEYSPTPAGEYGVASGFIYFIASGEGSTQHVKVGFTSGDPFKRMAALQVGCPHKLEMIGVIMGNPKRERAIHERLGGARVSGEWFEFNEETRDAIRAQLEAPAL